MRGPANPHSTLVFDSAERYTRKVDRLRPSHALRACVSRSLYVNIRNILNIVLFNKCCVTLLTRTFHIDGIFSTLVLII